MLIVADAVADVSVRQTEGEDPTRRCRTPNLPHAARHQEIRVLLAVTPLAGALVFWKPVRWVFVSGSGVAAARWYTATMR